MSFFVFDANSHEYHIAEQTIRVDVLFFLTGAVIVTECTAFALLLSDRLVSIISEGRKVFDLIKTLL